MSIASVGPYRTCPVEFWSLLAVEHLQGPHHQWRIRCLSPHPLQHVFNCPTHQMQLTVQALWDNPTVVADFLNLDNCRLLIRREKLLGYHKNNMSIVTVILRQLQLQVRLPAKPPPLPSPYKRPTFPLLLPDRLSPQNQ